MEIRKQLFIFASTKLTNMEFITYKGKQYPIKKFTVKINGENQMITVSVESLSDALGVKKEVFGTVESEIDGEIYYYVPDEKINLRMRDLAQNHLDEPLEYVPAYTFRITYRNEIYLQADSEKEAKDLFSNMDAKELFEKAEFVEIVSVEAND